MKNLLSIFGPAIPASIFTALAWYYINRFVPHAGKGILENQSWPLNNIYLCAAAGAALMSAASAIQLMFSHHRQQSLEAAAVIAGLEFQGTIDRNDLMYTGNLRVLDNWSNGTNSAVGKINGTSVQVVDVETTHTSHQTGPGHHGGDSTSRHYQTVYLLPADDIPFPSVSLVRRGGLQWASELLGFKGMEFYAEQSTASAQDQQTLTDFHNRYMVTQGAALKSSLGSQDVDDEAALFLRLGEVIGLPLLRRLTEDGQWNLELCSSHVAIWKSRKLVKPNELPQQLNEVFELHRLLIEHDNDRSEIPLAVRGSAKMQVEANITALLPLAVSGCVGMFLAFALFMPIFFLFVPKYPWIVFVWPFFGMGIMALSIRVGMKAARSSRK